MGQITFKKAGAITQVVQVEAKAEPTLIAVLTDFAEFRWPKHNAQLWLAHRTKNIVYRVTGFDIPKKQVHLVDERGQALHPVVGEREDRLYHTVWRT